MHFSQKAKAVQASPVKDSPAKTSQVKDSPVKTNPQKTSLQKTSPHSTHVSSLKMGSIQKRISNFTLDTVNIKRLKVNRAIIHPGPSSAVVAPSSSSISGSGVPVDFVATQLGRRSAKRTRHSSNSGSAVTVTTADDSLEWPTAAITNVKEIVQGQIDNIVAYNWLTEEFCQTKMIKIMEAAVNAEKKFTQELEKYKRDGDANQGGHPSLVAAVVAVRDSQCEEMWNNCTEASKW